MKVLVLGSGGAGVSAVQAIRSVDKKIDISLVSKEEHMPYSLCGLPDFLAGEISFDILNRMDSDFFAKNDVNLMLGKEAIKVDPLRKMVHFKKKSSGDAADVMKFDKLLIATGSKPIIPSIKGLDKKRVYIVSDLESCIRIIKGLEKTTKIAVMGGGFVGVECAQALKQRVKEVTVIETLDHILAKMFDEEISNVAQNMLEGLGINIVLDNPVKEIFGNDVVEGLILKNGKIECDMVLLTVGFQPNLDIVKDSMIRVNQGIIVNDFMESSVKDIFAAGDVAESFDCIYGETGLKPTWSNAVEQGRVAGLNITGKKYKYAGFQSYNIIHINDVPFLSMGNVTNLPQNCSKLVLKDVGSMRKVFVENDKILGMEFYGNVTNSGHLFSLLNKGSEIKGYNEKILSNYFQYRWNRNVMVKKIKKKSLVGLYKPNSCLSIRNAPGNRSKRFSNRS